MNTEAEQVDAQSFLVTLQRAFMGRGSRAAIWVPRRPWSEVIDEPARARLAEDSVQLHCGRRVPWLRVRSGACGRDRAGERGHGRDRPVDPRGVGAAVARVLRIGRRPCRQPRVVADRVGVLRVTGWRRIAAGAGRRLGRWRPLPLRLPHHGFGRGVRGPVGRQPRLRRHVGRGDRADRPRATRGPRAGCGSGFQRGRARVVREDRATFVADGAALASWRTRSADAAGESDDSFVLGVSAGASAARALSMSSSPSLPPQVLRAESASSSRSSPKRPSSERSPRSACLSSRSPRSSSP